MLEIGTAPKQDAIKATDTQNFEKDVLQVSMQKPVVVDFWAPWCGPCKQLMPMLEKAVAETAGAVLLVKVDIDANPELAQALRIQSVPTVFAFWQGQPVDGFMGARSESELKAFITKLRALAVPDGRHAPDPAAVKKLLAEADDLFRDENTAGAMEKYSTVFDLDPENKDAVSGIAWCLFAQGDMESVNEMLQQTPEAERDARLQGLAEIRAMEGAAGALAASGDFAGAIDIFAEAVRRNPKDIAAREALVGLLTAMGPQHPLTAQGRRKLSSVLFS